MLSSRRIRRTGEITTLKKISQHNINRFFLGKLCTNGQMKKVYKTLELFFIKAKKIKKFSIYRIIDKLVLRFHLLEISRRGKKLPVPLPIERNLSVSIFMDELIKLIRKNNIKLSDIPNYLITIFSEARRKKGILYTKKKEAYEVAKQNTYATKRIYISKINKK